MSGESQRPAVDEAGLAELADQYELLAELGRGGSAVVFRARDRRLQREVALKAVRLAPALGARERAVEIARLAREARTTARLDHPHIVTVYAVHELRDGLAVAMQHVPGRSLKQLLAGEGALDPSRAVRLVGEVASALAYAHAHGVVHRDVKPENIFVEGASGRALLADFGAARAGEADVRVTRTGATVGTPAYMSPEQIDGGPVDGRADLYSLGLVAWEALTGRRPWEGAGLYQVLHHQKHDQLPPIGAVRPAELPPVPLAVEYVVARLLEKRPAARWASAEVVASQLAHPVLPDDYRLWARAHRRRLAEHVAARRGAGSPREPVSTVSPTEQLRPGAADAAGPAAPSPTRIPTPAGDVPADEAPSWARSHPASRRRWYAGATMAAVLLAAVPAAVRWSDAPRPEPPRVSVQRMTAGVVVAPTTVVIGQSTSAESAAAGTTVGEVARDGLPSPAAQRPATTDSAVLTGTPLVGDTGRRVIVAALPTPRPAAPPVAAPATLPPTAAPAATSLARLVVRPEPPASIAAGGRHTCAIDPSGLARCWGANESGQLGAGDLSARDGPTPVAGQLRFAQIATGGAHSCGLTADGDAYCWGDDDHGQLGDATTSLRDAPVRVAGPARFRTLRAGLDHSCGVTTAGTLACWGANAHGQLGDGTTRDRATPVTVAGLRAATVAVGWRHTCALTPEGTALCWGDNANGQLGDGSRTARLAPIPVAGGRTFVAIAAGATHTCAAATDGATYCWGTGGASAAPHPTPARVEAGAPFVTLAAGSVHTCGRTAAGQLLCWGRNPYGQLGDGTTSDRWRPTRVAGGPYTAVSAAGAHTCAVAGGTPVCWGYNVSGQLGDGTRAHRATPGHVARTHP